MRRNRSITARAAILTVAVLAVYLPAAGAAMLLAGAAGLAACGMAATACYLGAVVALFIGHFARGPLSAPTGAMLGMFARMGFPLAMAVGCAIAAPRPDPAPLYWLLIFYPVALTVEILLTLERGGAPSRSSGETWT